jgi:hypothetical protein
MQLQKGNTIVKSTICSNILMFLCVPLQNTPQNDATRGDEDSEVTILRQELAKNYSSSKRKKFVHFKY